MTHIGRYEIIEKIENMFSIKKMGCRIQDIKMPYLEMERRLIVAAARGEAPDIASLIYLWTPILAYYDALLPLDDLYTYEIMNKLFPSTVAPLAYRDHIYGFNWSNAPNILYYNKRLLTELFGSGNFEAETYDDLSDNFIRIHEKSRGSVIPFSIPILDDEIFFLYNLFNFFYAFGGGLLNDDDEVIFNSEANIKAFKWLKKTINSGKINIVNNFVANRELFAQGKMAFIIEGPWLLKQIESYNPEIKADPGLIGYCVLPKGPAGKSVSILWNHTLSVFRQCSDKELALEFVKFLATDKDVNEMYYRQAGMIPVLKDELYGNPLYDDSFGRVLKAQMEHALPIRPGKPDSFMMAITICAKASREILLGDADAAATLNNHASILREIYRTA